MPGWQQREHAGGEAAGEKSLVRSSVPWRSICTDRRNTRLTKSAKRSASQGRRSTSMSRQRRSAGISTEHAVKWAGFLTRGSPGQCSWSAVMANKNESIPPGGFPTTRWSRVVAAGDGAAPEAGEALAELCDAYWFPLYAFIRRKGNGPERALDLTQGYFARLLERRTVAAADPARGRFRSFLLADCSHFLAHERERDGAARRGGGRAVLSIDARDAEGRYLLEPAHEQTAERLFERDWALALLEGVLAGLRAEYERSGRGAVFEALKGVLTDAARSVPQAELARRLGTTEAAVQVAVHRLRKRYRVAPRGDCRHGRRPSRGGRRASRPVRRPGAVRRFRGNSPAPVWSGCESGREGQVFL